MSTPIFSKTGRNIFKVEILDFEPITFSAGYSLTNFKN